MFIIEFYLFSIKYISNVIHKLLLCELLQIGFENYN